MLFPPRLDTLTYVKSLMWRPLDYNGPLQMQDLIRFGPLFVSNFELVQLRNVPMAPIRVRLKGQLSFTHFLALQNVLFYPGVNSISLFKHENKFTKSSLVT